MDRWLEARWPHLQVERNQSLSNLQYSRHSFVIDAAIRRGCKFCNYLHSFSKLSSWLNFPMFHLPCVPSSVPVTVTWPRRLAPTAASAWSSPSTAPRTPKWRHALTRTVHWPFLGIRLLDNVRGHPFITFTNYSWFWTPFPPLFTFHATYQYCHSRKSAISLNPPPPPSVRT